MQDTEAAVATGETPHDEEEAHAPHVGHHGPHAAHAGHGGNTKVALMVTVIAALLAVAEISGKGAQTEALVGNVTSNDLWAFYQAKTIRQTVLRTASEVLGDLGPVLPADAKAKLDSRVQGWNTLIERYESDPKTRDGRKELQERAREAENERDRSLAVYHSMELSSAAYELAIVLSSISMMVRAPLLVWVGAGLGILGAVLMTIGWLQPGLLPEV